ncbi:hypothetical protein DPMN_161499 [Dreissena polymorpha]|uniref:Uncharacterized protein n=1 Tax=Dreissena polymorpha TaxID=45954 RepID=A0A9D4ET91_DREPO|nr:hypothetical protein DPMN_161499 [Dreissena polymorpha]
MAVHPVPRAKPACSKFHYEEQLLDKMIRAEIHIESLDKKLQQCLTENLQSGKELKGYYHLYVMKFNKKVQEAHDY